MYQYPPLPPNTGRCNSRASCLPISAFRVCLALAHTVLCAVTKMLETCSALWTLPEDEDHSLTFEKGVFPANIPGTSWNELVGLNIIRPCGVGLLIQVLNGSVDLPYIVRNILHGHVLI